MLNKKSLSIDLGSRSLKCVVGQHKKNSVILEQAFTITIPKGLYAHGKIEDMGDLSTIIKNAMKDHHVHTKNTILSLQSSTIITREIEVPFVDKKQEMNQIIKYELEAYLPIQLDDYVIQYKLIEKFVEIEGTKAKMSVALLQKSTVESCLSLLKASNLKPKALDIHPNAISKLFHPPVAINREELSGEETIGLVDIGYGSISITIVKNGEFVFNRLIDQGTEQLIQAMTLAFDIPQEEAEQRIEALKDVGLYPNDTMEMSMVADMIRTHLQNWTVGIQRVFKYYTSRQSGMEIDKVYVLGGIASMQGIAEYLGENLNMRTYSIEGMNNIDRSNMKNSFEVKPYLNAIGALIRR